MLSTPYTAVLLIVGCLVALAGIALALYVVARPARRRARRLPARRPDRRIQASGGVVPAAGRLYVSRAAGAQPARDRVVAPPVKEAGATTYPTRSVRAYPVSQPVGARAGRHRTHAGAVR